MTARCWLWVCGCVLAGGVALAQGPHHVGGGVHAWTTVDRLDDEDISDNGLSYVASYRYDPGSLLSLGADLEFFPGDFVGYGSHVYAPEVMALVGAGVYAGLGAGWFYYDGAFASDPFYFVRAGVDLEVLPGLHLDLHGNYLFTQFEDIGDMLKKVDTDTVTVGAALRVEL